VNITVYKEYFMKYEKFIHLLAEELLASPEQIAPQARLFDDLGMKSIDVVHLIRRVEIESGRSLGRVNVDRLATVERLYQSLSQTEVAPSKNERAVRVRSAAQPDAVLAGLSLPGDSLADVQTLVEMIQRRAALDPDGLVITHEGATLRYGQLAREMTQMACALAAEGIAAGDRVSLVLPHDLRFFAAFYALLALGPSAAPRFHVPQPQRTPRRATLRETATTLP